ncbi:MAG TPA: hypothetical protein GXX25_14795 [Desulfotomaculum sp.]|nr:hypothetical protein [Desulfotomaculum sp.]
MPAFQETAAWFLAVMEGRGRKEAGKAVRKRKAGGDEREGGKSCGRKIIREGYSLTWETLKPDWPLWVILGGLFGGAIAVLGSEARVSFRFRIAPPDGTTWVVTLGTFLLHGGITFWTMSEEETEARFLGTTEKDGRKVFEVRFLVY